MCSLSRQTGKGKEKGKQSAPESKRARHDDDDDDEYLDFESTHFPTALMASHFFLKFMPPTVLPFYYVEMAYMTSLRIYN